MRLARCTRFYMLLGLLWLARMGRSARMDRSAKTTTETQQSKNKIQDIVLIGEGHLAPEPLVFFQLGNREEDLPECQESMQVCSKVNTYGIPWVERQCRCKSGRDCSQSLNSDDGYTVADKDQQFKICEPVQSLPYCHFYNDVSWTVVDAAGPNSTTIQQMHCKCKPGSNTYLLNIQFYGIVDGIPAFIYSFGCSQQKRMRCVPKQPCRLFSVHKQQKTQMDQVTNSAICQCGKGYRCPRRHTDPGSLPSKFYDTLGAKIYRAHCIPVHHPNELLYTIIQ